MISKECKITISGNTASIDSEIYLYKNDMNIKYLFNIVNSEYAYTKDSTLDNIINANKASYAQIKFKKEDIEIDFDVQETSNGKAILLIKKELIDEETELGDYTIQIRLFDESKSSVITLPPVNNCIHIMRPIFEKVDGSTNVVDEAAVDEAIVTYSESIEAIAEDGTFSKKVWSKGDKITSGELNRMEDGIAYNNSQYKDIVKQISNIKTDVEVTKDIIVLANDNTSIPTTAQQQEVTVEFTKGTTTQVPAFTNMITTSTTRQSTKMQNVTTLNEDELEYSANGTDEMGFFRYMLPNLVENHKYYTSIYLKTTASNCKGIYGSNNDSSDVTNEYTKVSGIFTHTSGAHYLGYLNQTMNSTDTYYMKKPLQIDLTTVYGEGNEPTLEQFENLIGDNWCLGTYTPSETISNDFTIKSYKSDNSLLDTFNSSTDTTINIIGGGYVNVTTDVLPTFVILKNVKYTEKQNIGTTTPSSSTKEFEGLKWGVIGDSLTDSTINADTKYHKIIAEKTGITVQELAKGGTGYTAGYSTNDTYYDRILTLDTDCDIVTLFGSVNDWKNNQHNTLCKEIGTISDTFDDSKSVIENTFYANLNRTFDTLVNRVPKAQIIVFGAMPYYGVNQTYFKNVRDALIAVCNDRHIPYNDMFDSTGFYRIMNNGIYAQAYTTDYSETNYDTQTSFGHPNNLAHKKIIAPMFLCELRKHL